MNSKLYLLYILLIVNICLTIYLLYICLDNNIKEPFKIKKIGKSITKTVNKSTNEITSQAEKAAEEARKQSEKAAAEAQRQAEQAAAEAKKMAEKLKEQLMIDNFFKKLLGPINKLFNTLTNTTQQLSKY